MARQGETSTMNDILRSMIEHQRRMQINQLRIPRYNKEDDFESWAITFARLTQGDLGLSESEMIIIATRKLEGYVGKVAQFAAKNHPNDWREFIKQIHSFIAHPQKKVSRAPATLRQIEVPDQDFIEYAFEKYSALKEEMPDIDDHTLLLMIMTGLTPEFYNVLSQKIISKEIRSFTEFVEVGKSVKETLHYNSQPSYHQHANEYFDKKPYQPECNVQSYIHQQLYTNKYDKPSNLDFGKFNTQSEIKEKKQLDREIARLQQTKPSQQIAFSNEPSRNNQQEQKTLVILKRSEPEQEPLWKRLFNDWSKEKLQKEETEESPCLIENEYIDELSTDNTSGSEYEFSDSDDEDDLRSESTNQHNENITSSIVLNTINNSFYENTESTSISIDESTKNAYNEDSNDEQNKIEEPWSNEEEIETNNISNNEIEPKEQLLQKVTKEYDEKKIDIVSKQDENTSCDEHLATDSGLENDSFTESEEEIVSNKMKEKNWLSNEINDQKMLDKKSPMKNIHRSEKTLKKILNKKKKIQNQISELETNECQDIDQRYTPFDCG